MPPTEGQSRGHMKARFMEAMTADARGKEVHWPNGAVQMLWLCRGPTGRTAGCEGR